MSFFTGTIVGNAFRKDSDDCVLKDKKKELAQKRQSRFERKESVYNSRMKAERKMDELLGYTKKPFSL
jgi:hypothetical protein